MTLTPQRFFTHGDPQQRREMFSRLGKRHVSRQSTYVFLQRSRVGTFQPQDRVGAITQRLTTTTATPPMPLQPQGTQTTHNLSRGRATIQPLPAASTHSQRRPFFSIASIRFCTACSNVRRFISWPFRKAAASHTSSTWPSGATKQAFPSLEGMHGTDATTIPEPENRLP